MTRQVVLDTETTGLSPQAGHRIIEIGCVVLEQRLRNGDQYQQYINPNREVDPGALQVHGISNAFLADKPRFRDIIEDFIEFIRGAELIIHNAAFDVGFINHELALAGRQYGQVSDYCTVFDTLTYAREKHPGQKNNLDALCKRYGINNTHRNLHGALLDADILANVYLMMTGGQDSLSFETVKSEILMTSSEVTSSSQADLIVIEATAEDMQAHTQYLTSLDAQAGQRVWGSVPNRDET